MWAGEMKKNRTDRQCGVGGRSGGLERTANDEGEESGKAGPKRKGEERERERPTPCTCVTVRPRTRRRVLISQRAPRRRASFCEPCFFRHGARCGRGCRGRAPYVGGGRVEKSMVEAAGRVGGGEEGRGGEGGGRGRGDGEKVGCKECHDLAQRTCPV